MGKRIKRRKSGVGAFFGGTFFGFLLGLGAVVGIGAFAYFKVSPNWINSTFKTDINLGNDEINSKTISDVVNTLIGIGSNSDTYSFSDLKNDFGVELPNDLMGINIEDLKSVPLAQLADAAQEKLSSISAKELENLFSSESLDNIMSKTVTFYYNNNKLYETSEHLPEDEVTFKYTIENAKVKIKNFDPIAITADHTVDITLELLPLSVALDSFVGNLGDNVTLQELKLGYGVDLPDFLYNGNETRKVNDLQAIISELTVGKMLNVKLDAGSSKYYVDSNNNSVKDLGEAEASSIILSIKDTTINGLSEKINSLTVADVFPNRTGFLSLIKNANKVLLTGAAHDEYITISTAIDNVMKDSTLGELIEAEVINNAQLNTIKDKWIKESYLPGKTTSTNYVQIKSLTIDQLVSLSSTAFSMVPNFLQDSNPNA